MRAEAGSTPILAGLFSSPFRAAGLIILVLTSILLRPTAATAAGDPGKITAIPVTKTPPVIDGKLDDAAWAEAAQFTDFKTFKPDFGKTPSQKTVGYLISDADNIYFAGRIYETDPSKIKVSVSRRDNIDNDDCFALILDTFNDTQSAYMFMVNAYGIQEDSMINSQGNGDSSQDMVWYSKGVVDAEGWTVEVRIPLKSIRFPNRKSITMKAFFYRVISRTSEAITCPALDPAMSGIVMQGMPVVFSGLKYKRVAEFIPALTYSNTYEAQSGQMVKTAENKDFSLTGKVGLTSDLVLDGTYNPDFSQVEADAAQVDINLRYDLYYEEKRPFFLEGSDIWKFAGTSDDAALQSVVYTRTISDPDFGFKLAGKISSRDTIAAIYARDNEPDAADRHPDFTIFRYKHNLWQDSYVGAFYTGKEMGEAYNRVPGLDGMFRLGKGATLAFNFFQSFTLADGADKDADGHAYMLDYSYYTRTWETEMYYNDISKDFAVDTGYLTRTGFRRINAYLGYQFYPKNKFFLKIEPFFWSYQLYDTVYDMWETWDMVALRFFLPRSTQVRFDAAKATETYVGFRFNRDNARVQVYSQLDKRFAVELTYRYGDFIYYDSTAPYQGYGNRLAGEVVYQPTDKLNFGLDLTYYDFFRQSDGAKIYDYTILRSRNTFQVNKYVFFRGIVEYNAYRRRFTVDSLVSFTYIPGTVFYAGYGSAYERLEWNGTEYTDSERYMNTKHGFFCKLSYLVRL